MKAKKKTIIWVIIVIILGGGIFYFTRSEGDESKYVTTKVEKDDIKQTVSITGEIAPVSKASLSFETSGVVENIYFEVGDRVEKGDRIARVDNSVVTSQLNEAYLEVERQEELLGQKRRNWEELSPEEKAAAKLAVEKARANAWTLQSQVGKSVLYSPIDGVVIKKYIDRGELATVSATVVTIMGEGGLEVKANIPESDIAKVQVGQMADVTFDAFSSDEIFEVRVATIEPAATIIQEVVYYEVVFDILRKDERMKVGMSADIDILTAEKEDVLVIPGQAVKNAEDRKYVEILVESGESREVKATDVKTGLRGDNGLVEVLSGLTGGEKVITFIKEDK